MHQMDIDLRKYLQQNQTTWKEKVQITFNIINALEKIHYEKAIHRDLHSGNVLYSLYIILKNLRLVILDFVVLQTNHRKKYMEIFLI